MPSKKHRPEEIIGKLGEAEVVPAECMTLRVARKLKSDDVLAALAELFVTRGPPAPEAVPSPVSPSGSA